MECGNKMKPRPGFASSSHRTQKANAAHSMLVQSSRSFYNYIHTYKESQWRSSSRRLRYPQAALCAPPAVSLFLHLVYKTSCHLWCLYSRLAAEVYPVNTWTSLAVAVSSPPPGLPAGLLTVFFCVEPSYQVPYPPLAGHRLWTGVVFAFVKSRAQSRRGRVFAPENPVERVSAEVGSFVVDFLLT